MKLTNDQIIERYHKQQRDSKLYWLKYKIEIRLLREKCNNANIVVSQNEIVNDDEYKQFVAKQRNK